MLVENNMLFLVSHGLYLSFVYFEIRKYESYNFIRFQDSFGYPDHFVFSYEFKIQFFSYCNNKK